MTGIKGVSGAPGQSKHELHCWRISESKKGVPFTQEHKQALSAAHKARYSAIHSIMLTNNISYKEALALYKQL
jgi:hypothetical protein